MISEWKIFSLQGAVCGISNSGIEYDESSLVLADYEESFDTKEKCINYLIEKEKDYKERKVEFGRYIITETYFNEKEQKDKLNYD